LRQSLSRSASLTSYSLLCDFVDFSRQVKTNFATFGRTSAHVVIFDDLKRDPGSVYEKELRFLGASLSFVPKFVVVS